MLLSMSAGNNCVQTVISKDKNRCPYVFPYRLMHQVFYLKHDLLAKFAISNLGLMMRKAAVKGNMASGVLPFFFKAI